MNLYFQLLVQQVCFHLSNIYYDFFVNDKIKQKMTMKQKEKKKQIKTCQAHSLQRQSI